MKTGITITSAEYVGGYKIKITFSDGKINTFDYESIVMREHEESIPYRNIENFKKFKIIGGCEIAWGRNWDMILSLHTIYTKTSLAKSGRKRISDKKGLVRLYIPKSIIKAHGGMESAQKKASEYLLSINH